MHEMKSQSIMMNGWTLAAPCRQFPSLLTLAVPSSIIIEMQGIPKLRRKAAPVGASFLRRVCQATLKHVAMALVGKWEAGA